MAAKIDYYELLGIDQTTPDDQLKAAYKRQALIWHPDKNSDRIQEATERFKQIQEAYTVLSDPRERAWYDSHKDQILTGKKDSEIDLWPYFSNSAYPGGFTDEPDGFFTVYDGLFESISQQENKSQRDKSQIQIRPRFGTSQTDIDEVLRFYRYWCNFVTQMEFSWADEYNPNDAPDRRIRRLIEAENKKSRLKEKRAFNEEIRSLVEYVKKRDPRWNEYVKAQEEERIQKLEEGRIRKIEEEQKIKLLREEHRKAEAQRYAEEYERMVAEGLIEEEEEEEIEVLYCDACKKKFSSEKQWENHEKSKKHKQNMQKFAKRTQQPKPAKKAPPPPPPKPEPIPPMHQQAEEDDPFEEEERLIEEEEKRLHDEILQDESEEEDDIDLSQFLIKRGRFDSEDHPPPPPPTQPAKMKKSAKAQQEEEVKVEPPKVGKAKKRREKKKQKQEEDGAVLKCNACNQKFNSRNKLFDHLKKTGHERRV